MNSQFFKLTADIDLGGNEWTPIGGYYHCFKGTFNGDGHTVSNFKIKKSDDNYIGLFRYNNGTIMNLGVEKAEISGKTCVGGVCGFNDGVGTIRNCYNTGAVKGEATVGGVCGDNQGDTIRNCYNTGAVKGELHVGGVCGSNNEGTITNCYYNTDFCTVGGIESSDVEGSATGRTSEELCNIFGDDEIWQSGVYSCNDSTADCTLPSLIGVGEAQTIRLYNFGTSDSPDWQLFTEITTKDELKAIGEDETSRSKNYILGADIDLGGEEITPIGGSDNPFTGKFSGDGHTVSNFKINKPDDYCIDIGLFGYNEGTIINLGVENAEITGYDYVGGVCGENNGTIQNCYNTGKVKGETNVGGVCGYNVDGTFTNCYYNKDFCTVGGINGSDVAGSATGLTTLQMTDGNALETMKFDSEWSKKANDKDGIAYYPSLKESGYQPSVEFTKKLELEKVGDKTPVYGDKIEFRTKALITFINAFGGEDITFEDTAGVFVVNLNGKSYSVTDNKFEYTANTVGKVTFTLVYKDGSSDYFPKEYSEDVVVTIEKRNSTPVGPVGPVGPNIPANPTTPANSDVQLNPNEPQIKDENGKSGWNAIAQEVKSANDGDIITVDMNGTTGLPKKILEAIKGKDIDIVLDMGNGFVWTINGNDVKNTQSVDMSVSKGAKIPVRVLNKVTGENSYIAISLKHNGSFGFKAILTVELSKKNKGLFANLYYYNSKTKKTEFISSDKIGSDGKADFGFTHASDYVIVLDKANHGKPIVTATTTKNSIKLKWNAVSGATKYRVYKIVNGKARLVIETTKHGLNINKAKSDTEYQYIVRAYVDGSWTSMKKSDIVTIKTKQ